MGKVSQEDLHLIKALRTEKHWGATKMMHFFPNKLWNLRTLNNIIAKIDSTGDIRRKSGSGRPKTARTAANIAAVEELICSQENEPGSHLSPRKIERETGIRRSTVIRIGRQDLHLKNFKRVGVQLLTEHNKERRLQCCQQLLQRFPNDRSVRQIWFTDEKLFHVSAPLNHQNSRVYANVVKKKEVAAERILFERSHFSKSVMVSVAVSKMGKSRVVFVEPGAKINSEYYCYQLLSNGLLPDIRERCGHHNWTLQQDGAPSHRSAQTIAFLTAEGVNLIEPAMWPPNSPDLNPVDYAVWGALEERVYKHKPRNVDQLKGAITEEWGRLSQCLVTRSIAQWRNRLMCVVNNNGGHIEHIF
jgi:hypothetical protein